MNEQVYQHYRPEEAEFIDLVYDGLHRVDNHYVPVLLHFLTPREQMIAQQIVEEYGDFKIAFYGGIHATERRRGLIYPDYYQPTDVDYGLTLLQLHYPVKFADISHGKILGTLMSQGVDRNRIGDIISDGEQWQVVVEHEISTYLIHSIDKISNVGVRLEEMPAESMLISQEEWETESIVVSSMRLDTLISNVYNFSRQRAKDLIQQGNIKVNFTLTERPDIEVNEQDIISVRKFGRFWIESINGRTKKDNVHLTVNVLKR